MMAVGRAMVEDEQAKGLEDFPGVKPHGDPAAYFPLAARWPIQTPSYSADISLLV
jgi:hypothetical protein